MSSTRFCFAAWALGLSVLSGCPQEPASVVCPGTGIICPEDTYCGAVQPICLTTSCGNGIVDVNEQCDDGNIIEGDTCSPTCKREECGNSVLDPDEVCDDGNKVSGDGCAANCMSKETCGNAIVDVGEVCDDGNTINADGCSGTPQPVGGEMSPAPCKSTEVCGNGIRDLQVGEVCDDGNTASGDGCNSDCRSGEDCGNGIVDPGEQCDDHNLINGDGCAGNGHPLLNPCKFEFCGDKLKGTAEPCDYSDIAFGLTGNGACNRDCTIASCGDGKLSPFAPSNEQCDLGTANNALGLGCSPLCQLDHCGDNTIDGIEQCDNGTSNSANGPCLPWCRLATCGDGVVESASSTGTVPSGIELCDLGTALNGATTCAYGQTSCTICSATTCQPVVLNSAAATHYCGDANVDNTGGDTEACDNGTIGTASRPANGTLTCPYNTPCTTCKTDCTGPMMPTPAQCGDGTVDGPMEKCDFGATNNTTTLPTTCPYNSSCTTCPAGCATVTAVVSGGRCGDGNINSTPATGSFPVGPETCDNGVMNTTNVDCPWASTMLGSMCTRCSTSCQALTTVPHYCGDGQCDVGFEAPGGCTADCGTAQFSLTVVKTGAGDGGVTSSPAGITCASGSCTSASASFIANAMVTLTAAANGSSTFVGWGGACLASGTMAMCTVTMSSALTATANFAKIQRQLTVTKAGSGASVGTVTVMPAGTSCGAGCSSHDDGTVVVLTATPGTNNNFTMWSGCDSVVGTVCIVTVNGVEAVTATFTLDTAMLSITIAGAGTVTSSPAGITCPGTCTASFDVGSTVTLTATPTGAGVFNGFTGGCTTSACVIAPAGNSVTATFTP